MKRVAKISALILLALSFAHGQTNEWKGLRPLHSTKSDVEKLLGEKKRIIYPGLYEYRSGDERISVLYAEEACSLGWNAPIGTVLSIEVAGVDEGKSLDDLHLDRKKLSVTSDDAMYGTWTDPVAGIQYYFGSNDRFFEWIKYIPTRADNALRCDGFPPFAPEAQYFTMDTWLFHDPKRNRVDNLNGSVAALVNAVMAVRNVSGYKGYVLVYFDDKLPFIEYRRQLARVTQTATKRLTLSPGELTFIEGGMRRENRMELYVLPKDMKPPSPNPDLPSPQFMRKKGTGRKQNI